MMIALTLLALTALPEANTDLRESYVVDVVELNHVHPDSGAKPWSQYVYVRYLDGKRTAVGFSMGGVMHDRSSKRVIDSRGFEVKYTTFIETSSNFDREVADRAGPGVPRVPKWVWFLQW